uniref:Uncharacterized protein n=1 Tax=Anguilla anguilla TaxID=7936 RepID=A0A0E9UDQ4_ANGAN
MFAWKNKCFRSSCLAVAEPVSQIALFFVTCVGKSPRGLTF